MADNTTLPSGTGGDTVRTIDRVTAKTQVVQLDFGGEAGPESLATSGNPLPIQAASLPLPSGAATSANQATQTTSLQSIDGKTPALGAATIANSSPVNIASDQTVPVSAASLPLPSGAATAALQNTMQATLTTMTNLLDTQGQIIKLLAAILVTLGNNGGGYVDPEEAAQLTTLQ